MVQLRAMLAAGVPLLGALRTLREHAATPMSAKVLERIASVIESGRDLSQAFEGLPRCFDSSAVHLIAAGEKSGALDEALRRAAEMKSRQIQMSGKIRGALAYPCFLLTLTVIMTVGILVLLVPKFEGLLMSRPELLPDTTRLVLASSTFLRESPWFAIAVGISFLATAIALAKSRTFRRRALEGSSHLPVVGDLIRKTFIARSVNALAMTLESGVPILTGLEHCSKVADLPSLRANWDSAAAAVRDGRPLHFELAKTKLPPALVQMVAAGESSGSLDVSLRTASDFLDRETNDALEVFTSLLGPITVVIAGCLVGFVVVALMTPILEMAKFVG